MDEPIIVRMSGKIGSLTSTFSPVINVHGSSEIALVCLKTSLAFTEGRDKILINKENKFLTLSSPSNDSMQLDFPHGVYTIDNVNNHINKLVKTIIKRPFYFSLTLADDRKKCKIKSNYTIDFSVGGSIGPTLGFERKTYTPFQNEDQYYESEKQINYISKVPNSIKVMCNIAKGVLDNGQQSHSIYESFPQQSLEKEIVESPNNLIYYKLRTVVIKKIKIDLVDEENNPVKNSDAQVTIILHIRPIKS